MRTISHTKIDWILEQASSYGRLNIRRIYGDFTKDNLKNWHEKLMRHAITPIQKFAYTEGKNFTDIALIIDAMELLYNAIDLYGFCIVSSDGDFAPLENKAEKREFLCVAWAIRRRQIIFKNLAMNFYLFQSIKTNQHRN